VGFQGICDSALNRFTAKYVSNQSALKGFLPEKSSGQYTITNMDLVEKVLDAANLRSTDTVLELGAGFGTITSKLQCIARQLYFCESDENLASETMKKASAEGYTNVNHIPGDALVANFPRFDVCVSHMPYSLSAPIIFKLIKHRPLWRNCVMFVQREFADALIADPGERNYTRLSMNTSVFFRTERLSRVNGACFYPVPPVESALIRLTPRAPPPQFDFDEFNQLVKTCFIEKKRNLKYIFSRPSVEKQLEVNYKEFCSFNKIPTSVLGFQKYLKAALDDSGLTTYCAKQLPPEAIEHLLNVLHSRGIYFINMPQASEPPHQPVSMPQASEPVHQPVSMPQASEPAHQSVNMPQASEPAHQPVVSSVEEAQYPSILVSFLNSY